MAYCLNMYTQPGSNKVYYGYQMYRLVPVVNTPGIQHNHTATRQFGQMDYLGNRSMNFPSLTTLNAHQGTEYTAGGIYPTHQQSQQNYSNEFKGNVSNYSLMDLVNRPIGFEDYRHTGGINLKPEDWPFNTSNQLSTENLINYGSSSEYYGGRSSPGSPGGVSYTNEEDLQQTASCWSRGINYSYSNVNPNYEETKSGRSSPGGISFTTDEDEQKTLPLCSTESIINSHLQESYHIDVSKCCKYDHGCAGILSCEVHDKIVGQSNELSLENMLNFSSINEHSEAIKSEDSTQTPNVNRFTSKEMQQAPSFESVYCEPLIASNETYYRDSKNKIFIKGLCSHLNEDDIYRLLSTFGEIKFNHNTKKPSIWMWADKRTGLANGLLAVRYVEAESAMKAFKELNGSVINGSTVLKVEFERLYTNNYKQNKRFNYAKSGNKGVYNSGKNETIKYHDDMNDLSGFRVVMNSNDRGKNDSSGHIKNVKSDEQERHILEKFSKIGIFGENKTESEFIRHKVKNIPNGCNEKNSSKGSKSGSCRSHNNPGKKSSEKKTNSNDNNGVVNYNGQNKKHDSSGRPWLYKPNGRSQ